MVWKYGVSVICLIFSTLPVISRGRISSRRPAEYKQGEWVLCNFEELPEACKDIDNECCICCNKLDQLGSFDNRLNIVCGQSPKHVYHASCMLNKATVATEEVKCSLCRCPIEKRYYFKILEPKAV